MINHVRVGRAAYVKHILHGRDLQNPSARDIAGVCPHLSLKEIRESLMKGKRVALPPALPGCPLFIATYFRNEDDHCPFLVVERLSTRKSKRKVLYLEKAIAFAEKNWPD